MEKGLRWKGGIKGIECTAALSPRVVHEMIRRDEGRIKQL